MVDKVRCNVKKDSGAGAGALTPRARTELRTKAIIVRFKTNDASKNATHNELHDSLKIAVVPAVLVDGKHTALLICIFDKRDGFFKRGRERLVHKHIAPGGETLASEWIVRIVRRGDDNEADFLNGQKFVERAHDAHIRILRGGFVAAALQNRRQPQSGDGANYLRVKGSPGESESDETNIDHCGIQEGIVTAFKR